MECGKSYKTKDALKVHMHYIHTKDGFCKNCPDCGKQILSHGEYKLHREIMCRALKKKKKAKSESQVIMAPPPPPPAVMHQSSATLTVPTIQFAMKMDQM